MEAINDNSDPYFFDEGGHGVAPVSVSLASLAYSAPCNGKAWAAPKDAGRPAPPERFPEPRSSLEQLGSRPPSPTGRPHRSSSPGAGSFQHTRTVPGKRSTKQVRGLGTQATTRASSCNCSMGTKDSTAVSGSGSRHPPSIAPPLPGVHARAGSRKWAAQRWDRRARPACRHDETCRCWHGHGGTLALLVGT